MVFRFNVACLHPQLRQSPRRDLALRPRHEREAPHHQRRLQRLHARLRSERRASLLHHLAQLQQLRLRLSAATHRIPRSHRDRRRQPARTAARRNVARLRAARQTPRDHHRRNHRARRNARWRSGLLNHRRSRVSSLRLFALHENRERLLAEKSTDFEVADGGGKLLLVRDGKYFVRDFAENATETTIDTLR